MPDSFSASNGSAVDPASSPGFDEGRNPPPRSPLHAGTPARSPAVPVPSSAAIAAAHDETRRFDPPAPPACTSFNLPDSQHEAGCSSNAEKRQCQIIGDEAGVDCRTVNLLTGPYCPTCADHGIENWDEIADWDGAVETAIDLAREGRFVGSILNPPVPEPCDDCPRCMCGDWRLSELERIDGTCDDDCYRRAKGLVGMSGVDVFVGLWFCGTVWMLVAQIVRGVLP